MVGSIYLNVFKQRIAWSTWTLINLLFIQDKTFKQLIILIEQKVERLDCTIGGSTSMPVLEVARIVWKTR